MWPISLSVDDHEMMRIVPGATMVLAHPGAVRTCSAAGPVWGGWADEGMSISGQFILPHFEAGGVRAAVSSPDPGDMPQEWERGNETTLLSHSLQGPIGTLISLCPSSSPNHYVPSLEQSPHCFPGTSHSHPTKLLLQ